jgi:acyl-homoserine lactone acylase PvdQ
MSDWKWGDLHKLYLKHLSMLAPLSRGPYPEDGGYGILMNAPIPWDLNVLNNTVYVGLGPSLRIVYQMADNPNDFKVYFVYPGGESGNPVDQHYDDLVQLWLTYQYINITYYDSPSSFTNPSGELDLLSGG